MSSGRGKIIYALPKLVFLNKWIKSYLTHASLIAFNASLLNYFMYVPESQIYHIYIKIQNSLSWKTDGSIHTLNPSSQRSETWRVSYAYEEGIREERIFMKKRKNYFLYLFIIFLSPLYLLFIFSTWSISTNFSSL